MMPIIEKITEGASASLYMSDMLNGVEKYSVWYVVRRPTEVKTLKIAKTEKKINGTMITDIMASRDRRSLHFLLIKR
jgi:hypothetical protein